MLFVNSVVLWCDLYKLFQEIDFFLGRGPAGDETADGVVMVCLAEVGECHFATQPLCQLVGDDDELLVGGGVDEELVAFLSEYLLHSHGHLDGVLGEAEIENVSRFSRGGGE